MAIAVLALVSCAERLPRGATSGGIVPTYTLSLAHYHERVGQVVHMRAQRVFETDNTTTVAGAARPPAHDRVVVTVVGRWHVLAVDASQRCTHCELTVEEATLDVGAGPVALLAPGTVVDAVIGVGRTPTVPTVAGAPVDPVVAGFLRTALGLHYEDAADRTDAVYGTRDPQPVGGTWAVDLVAIGRGPLSAFARFSALEGRGRLVSASACGAAQCARVEIALTLRDFAPLPMRGMPADMVVRPGTGTATLEQIVRGVEVPPALERGDVRGSVDFERATPAGTETTHTVIHMERTWELEPVSG